MATKNLFALVGAAQSSADISDSNPLGYAANLSKQGAVDLLSNQEFLNDAANHFYEQDGTRFSTNEELVEAFMSDRRFRNLNSIGVGMDVYDAYTTDDKTGQRAARLQRVYEALPAFYDGIGGFGEVVKEVVFDPVNLIPLPGAKAAAIAAGIAARTAGKTAAQAGRAGIVAGAKRGAITEGLANTGIEAGFDAALQARDIELGIQDEFSTARLATSALAGGVLGAGLGGAIGAVASRGGGKVGFDTADKAIKTEELRLEAEVEAEVEAEANEGVGSLSQDDIEGMERARVVHLDEQAAALEAVERAEADGTADFVDGQATINTPEHKARLERVRALREIADWPGRRRAAEQRISELKAAEKPDLDEIDRLIQEYNRNTALWDAVSQRLDPKERDAVILEAANEHARTDPLRIEDQRGQAPRSTDSNVAQRTTGESPGIVGGGEPAVTSTDSTPGQQFRITPEQAATLTDASHIRNQHEALTALLGNEEASIDANNAIQSSLQVLDDRHYALTGRRINEFSVTPDVDLFNDDVDTAPLDPGEFVFTEKGAPISPHLSQIELDVDKFNENLVDLRRERKTAKADNDLVKLKELDEVIARRKARRDELTRAKRKTPPPTLKEPSVQDAPAITRASSAEDVADSDVPLSKDNIKFHLLDLDPDLYPKSRVDALLKALYDEARKDGSLTNAARVAINRDFVKAAVRKVEARGIFNVLIQDVSSDSFLADSFIAKIAVELEGQPEDLIQAVLDRHIEEIEETASFILHTPLVDTKGNRDAALELVAENYGTRTRDIVEAITRPAEDQVATATSDPDVSRIVVDKKTEKKVRAEHAANLARAEELRDVDFAGLRQAYFDAVKKANPGATADEIDRRSLTLFLQQVDRQNTAADKLAATGLKPSAVENQAATARASDIRNPKITSGATEPIPKAERKGAMAAAEAKWTRINNRLKRTNPGDLRDRLENELENARLDGVLARQGRVNIAGVVYERGLGAVNEVRGRKGVTTQHGAGTLRAVGKIASLLKGSNQYGFVGRANAALNSGRPLDEFGLPKLNEDGTKADKVSGSERAQEALWYANLIGLSDRIGGVSKKEIATLKRQLKPRGGIRKATEGVEKLIDNMKKSQAPREKIFAAVNERLASLDLTQDQIFQVHAAVMTRRNKTDADLTKLIEWHEAKLSAREVKEIRIGEARAGTLKRLGAIDRAYKKTLPERLWQERLKDIKQNTPEELPDVFHDVGVLDVATTMANDDWSRGLTDMSESIMDDVPFSSEQIDDMIVDADTISRGKAAEDDRRGKSDAAHRAFEDHGEMDTYQKKVRAFKASASRASQPPRVADEQKPAGVVHRPTMVSYDGIEVDLANDFRVGELGKDSSGNTIYNLTVLGRDGAGLITKFPDGTYSLSFQDARLGDVTQVYRTRTEMKTNWPRVYSGDIRAAFEAGNLSLNPNGGEGAAFEIDWRNSARYGSHDPIPSTQRVATPAPQVAPPQGSAAAPAWKRTELLNIMSDQLGLPPGRILAIQVRSADREPVSVVSLAKEQTPAEILGKKVNTAQYTIGHVDAALRGKSGGAAAKADFRPFLPDDPVVPGEQIAADVPTDAAADLATPKKPKPILVDDLDGIELNQSAMPAGLKLKNLGELHDMIINLELMSTVEIKNISDHIKQLEILNAAMAHPDHAPNGVKLRNSNRMAAFNDLTKIVSKHPAEDAVAMLRLLDRLAVNNDGIVPVMREARLTNGELTPYHIAPKPTRRFKDKPYDSNEIGLIARTDGVTAADKAINEKVDYTTGIFNMTHEVGHWGYLNILTPAERVTFWEVMRDTYGREDGTLDMDLMAKSTPSFASNRTYSPNELFANQFTQWAISEGRTGLSSSRLASIWKRFASAALELIQAFHFKSETPIDPRLFELFDRILPEDQLDILRYNQDLAAAKGNRGATMAATQLLKFDEWRATIAAAIDSDSFTAKMEALDTISRGIYFKYATNTRAKKYRVRALDGVGKKFGQGIRGKSARRARAFLLRASQQARTIIDAAGGSAETRKGAAFDTDILAGNTAEEAAAIRELLANDVAEIGNDLDDIVNYSTDDIAVIEDAFGDIADEAPDPLRSQWSLMAEHYSEGLNDDAYAAMAGLDLGLYRLEIALYNGQVEFRGMYKRNMNKAAQVTAGPSVKKPRAHYKKTRAEAFRFANQERERKAVERRNIATARNTMRGKTGQDIDPGGPDVKPKTMNLREVEAALNTLLLKGKETSLTSGRGKALRTRLEEIVRADPELELPLDLAVSDPAYIPTGLKEPEIRRIIQGAIESGNNELKRQAYRIIKMRGLPPKPPQTSLIGKALRIEAQDHIGTPKVNGIPASVTASIEEVLLRGTHRDPDIENTTRTILYRLLNLQGKAGRDALGNANFVDLESLYRIAGDPVPADARGAMLDMGDPIVNGAVKKVRRFSVGLHKERGDPLVLMHEVGEMVYTNFTERDLANIRTSFEEALKKGDRLAKLIVEKYAGKESTLAEALQGATALTRRGFLKGAAAATIRGVPFTKLGPVQQALVKAKEVGVDFTRVFSFRDKLMGVVDPKFGSFVPTRRYVTDANALRDDGSSAQLDYGNTPLRVDDADTELAFDTGDDAIFTGKGLDEGDHELTAAFGDALNTMDRDVPIEVARENAHRTYWGNPSNEEAAAIRNVYAAIKKQFGGIRDFLDGSDNLLKTVNEFSTSAFEHLDVSLGKKIDVKLSAKQVKKAIDKAKADGTYVEPPTIEQLSKEWFVEGWAQYLGERVARGDIFKVRQGEKPLILKGTLETLLDRLIEYAAYVLNGLIGRRTIRQQFRELTYFGDMFESIRKPRAQYDAVRSSGEPAAVSASMAQVYARQSIESMNSTRLANLRGFGGTDGPITVRYANDLNPAQRVDPDAEATPAPQDAPYGEGVYLASDKTLASRELTLEDIMARVEESTPNPAKRARAEGIANRIISNEAAIGRAQLDVSRAQRDLDNPLIDNDDIPRGNDSPEAHLAGRRRHLADLVQDDRILWDHLAIQTGVTSSPRVAPMVARAVNTIDLSDGATYSFGAGSNNIRYATKGMEIAGLISPEAHARLLDEMPESFSGSDYYSALTNRAMIGDGFAGDPVDARIRLTTYLKEMGYDSLRAGDDTLVVFDPAAVRHIDASDFDGTTTFINKDDAVGPPAFAGSLLEEIATSSEGLFDPRNFGPTSVELQRLGVPKAVTQVVRKMQRREPLTTDDLKATHEFGWGSFFNISKNSDHLRRGGAHWLAEFIQPANGVGFYEQHGALVGKALADLLHRLEALPDAGNTVTRWLKRSDFRSVNKKGQPASHAKIARWLRGNKTISLSTEEGKVARLIEKALDVELMASEKAGIIIGDIRKRGIDGYLTQIWDIEEMVPRVNEFVNTFTRWFDHDAKEHGAPITNAEAVAKAERLYRKMVDAEGMVDVGTTAPNEHAMRRALLIDWQALARTDPQLGRDLDSFLVNDLNGLLSKYFDQSVRRRLLAKSMGEGNHAFNSYISVAMGGRQATMGILRKGRVVGKPEYVHGDVRWHEEGLATIEHDVFVPIAQSEGHAAQIYDEVMAVLTANGNTASARSANKDAARNALLNASGQANTYSTNKQFAVRVDSIINGLSDFGGQDKQLATSGAKFMEAIMDTLHRRRPAGLNASSDFEQTVSRGLRSFNSVTLLGFTALTSIPDVALPLIRSGNLTAFTKGWHKWMLDPEYKRASQRIGTSIGSLISERMSGMHNSYGGAFQTAFFNATLLSPWTNMQREVATIIGHEALLAESLRAQQLISRGRMNSSAYRKTQRFLKRYGVEEYGQPGGPSMERDLVRIAGDETGKLDNLRFGIHRFVNESIYTPNPNDIPLWAQTPWGALVFQLKSFPLMMQRMALDVVKEFAKGNPRPFFYLVTAGVAFGAGASGLKDVVQRRADDDSNFRDRKITEFIGDDNIFGVRAGSLNDELVGWYAEGLLAAGGLGLIAELLYNAAAKADNGAWGTMRIMGNVFGPTFGLAHDVVNVGQGAFDALKGNDKDFPERSAARAIAARIPIVGGVRSSREAAANLVGDAATKSSGTRQSSKFGGGFGSSGFGGGF